MNKAKPAVVKDAGGAISKVQSQPNNVAPKGQAPTPTVAKVQTQTPTVVKGQTVTPVEGQGQDDVDGEELVKDSRVKFREWDPVSMISQ